MSAIEGLVRTILSSFDIDVEAIKADVTERISAFERNVDLLNSTLITIRRDQARIEQKIDALMLHLRIPSDHPQLTTDHREGANNA